MPTTRQQIDTWKTRLLDLSRRNRLLHARPNLGGTVAITHPASEALFDMLVRRGRKLAFAAVLTLEQQLAALSWEAPATGTTMRLDQLVAPEPKGDQIATPLPPADQERVLYNMRLRARTALSEQGINVLYLALGFLEWFEPGAGEALWRSPLLLLPVELQRATLGAEYTLRLTDDDVVLNPTLVHRLRQSFGLALPDLPDEIEDLQLEPFFTQVEALVAGRDGWQVAREALLGLFSFQKLLMYHDLERAAESPAPHPIVELLAGNGQASSEDVESNKAPIGANLQSATLRLRSGQVYNLQSLDERPPEDCYQVLDADSSQAEAIEAARTGASFVLHGPPGTGKSQTIANIIAECLAEGKRVLFVSEKMAALQVVFERLKQCGLDEFCLELHSHKASKRAVLDALGASLAAGPPPVDPAFPYAELAETRQQLNAYAKALHTPHGPLRWTPFLVHGRLATLADAPDTNATLGELDSYSAEQLGAIEALLARLDARSELLQSMPENVWRGCAITVSSFEQRGRMRAQLRSLIAAAQELPARAAVAAAPIGLPAPENLAAARALAGLLHLLSEPHTAPAEWLADPAHAARRQALLAEAQACYAGLAALEQQLFQRYQEAMLELELDGLLGRFTTQYAAWWRVLRPQYHRDIAAIRAALRPGAALAPAQAAGDLKLAIEVRGARRWVEQNRAMLAEQFAPLFADRATGWAQLETVAAWVARLLSLNLPLPAQVVEMAGQPPAARRHVLAESPALDAALAKLDAELSFLKELDLANVGLQGERLERARFSTLHSQLSTLLERIADLDAWWEYCDLRRAADPFGLAAYLDALSADAAAAAQPRRAFHKRFAALWLDAAYERMPVLRRFQRAPHQALIERFRVLDREQLAAAQVRLHRLLAARRPAPNTVAAPGSELAILRRELQKQRRHKPIRQLFREIPALLGRLKPCLMMSPLSVSQFLEPDAAAFDLVIFDEASQIRTEDAIGAVLRGQALLVVGDNKQLPPTSFFMTGDEQDLDAEDAELADSFESILDAASAAGLPMRLLRWHYRSRDETLITFSNTHFYDRRLATFPSAIARNGRGVSLVYVADGLYDRQGSRTNLIEARRVADLVVEHLKTTPHHSLGVVAFGQPQQLAILHELERRRAADQALAPLLNPDEGKGDEARDEPFFVKNLENVQGDERDVMIVSVGYGRDASGRVLMNFGPLNQQGGERRLNVAITRAREQVVLVSSLLPEDIDTRRTQHPGPRLLRDYLEYARRGGPASEESRIEDRGLGVDLQSSILHPLSSASPRFEDKLAVALARRGLVLARQIGHSDFRIDIAVRDPQHPSEFLLGVECDGNDYRDAPTARDRERLREQVLATLGWKIHRAWSAAWARDPESEIARVFAALEIVRDARPVTAAPEEDQPE